MKDEYVVETEEFQDGQIYRKRARGRRGGKREKKPVVTISVNVSPTARENFYKMADSYVDQTGNTIGTFLEQMISNAFLNWSPPKEK